MAYKNKDKQREADRARQQRRRDKKRDVSQGVTPKGVTNSGCDEGVTIEPSIAEFDKIAKTYNKPTNYGLPNCECKHCQQTKNSKLIVNHGAYKPAHELGDNEVNRVSLPGDIDYTNLAQTESL